MFIWVERPREIEKLINNLNQELTESTLYKGFCKSLPGGGLD